MSGSNGYLISIVGFGNRVALSTVDGDFEGAATYEVPGRVHRDQLRATFGKLGRVATEFRPSGRVKYKRPPRRCEGKPRKTTFGVFVGTIRFRGEQGYTRVALKRAKGSLQSPARWRCKQRGGSSGAGPMARAAEAGTSTVLEATASRSRLSFKAVAARPVEERGLTLFSANSSERRGQMKIERLALAFGRERTFLFDDDLGTATVTPPQPFSGSGAYVRNADGTAGWTGSLRVDFPGARNRSLVNKTFTARLYRP